MEWAKNNVDLIIIAGVVLVQLVNAGTTRWDAMSGAWPKRVLLLLTEMSSVLTSRHHATWLANVPLLGIVLGRLKLPLNPYGGKAKTSSPPEAVPTGPAVLLLLFIGGVLVVDGCKATWEQDSDRAISVAKIAAEGGWDTTRAIYRQRCGALINTCVVKHGDEMCADYEQCKLERRNYSTAFGGVLEMCALASEALIAYEQLKASGAEESELLLRRAEVQERIDRATRQSGSFMRSLETERATQ